MLREYLYVDITRVRSLLAQLDKGVVEEAVDTRAGTSGTGIGGAIVGFKAERATEATESVQESRSLQELLYSVFEEIADSGGVIRDLAGTEVEAEQWHGSHLHDALVEGELVRVFLPVLIIDPAFLNARLRRFVTTNTALTAFGAASMSATIKELRDRFDTETEEHVAALSMPRDQRRKAEGRVRREREKAFERLEAAARAAAPVTDAESVENVARFFEAYLPDDTIDVRFLAEDDSNPRLSFAGSLLGRDEYIQREREALYSRYGSLLTGWTSVLQVARIPDQEAGKRARERDFSSIELVDDDVINRSKVLQSAVYLTEMLEARGIAEGPLWPTISVIPLAIYRMVPRTEEFQ